MSQPLNADYYNVSDTDDGSYQPQVDISDIIGGIDLNAIQAQLLNQRAPNPRPRDYFQDAQNQFNTYIPKWMDTNVNFWLGRHPGLRPDDTWQVRDDWILPSEYAKYVCSLFCCPSRQPL